MYAIHGQTDPPTAIDHAMYCRVLNMSEKQLVVAGGNYLRVYQVTVDVASHRPDGTLSNETRLECILQFRLFGNISSISSCLIPGHLRECLVIAFEEAKLSLLQYEPELHDLRTMSIHHFEDEVLKGGFTQQLYNPVVRCDPENRCSAMLVYGRHLAVVPLLKDTSTYDEDGVIGTGGTSADTPINSATHSATTPGGTTAGSSHLGLQSYTVSLENLDEKLGNIADMCFLFGYYEPTLLFLYEPNPTTSGRIALRVDTFCIVAVSLNIKERTNAVIWTMHQLPYDLYRLQPVPKPIGGVIIFGANDMLYLNQSVPPYGIVVNSNLREATSFPLKSQEDKQILLDGSTSDFIDSRTLVLCLRSGDVYVLTLLVDNMNIIKSMHLDKAASSVIPSACCKCDDGLFFQASRLGNSLLLRYFERNSFTLRVETTQEQLPALSAPGSSNGPTQPLAGFNKRPRTDDSIHEEVDIYGEVIAIRQEELMNVTQYSFEVCDSLLNIAPCRSITFGEPVQVPEDFAGKMGPDPVVDMVVTSGHNKNGAVTVLQRSVRPCFITSSPILNARHLWTVGRVHEYESGLLGAQKYLLISKEVDTMVLEMKEEITELEASGFEMNQRTVAAGNLGIGDGDFVVQITPMSLILLRNAQRVQIIQLKTSFPVAQASISDPFIVMVLDNGELLTAVFEPTLDGSDYHLVLSSPQIQQPIPATAVCIYKDVSGLYTTEPLDPELEKKGVLRRSNRILLSARHSAEGGLDFDMSHRSTGASRAPVLSEDVFSCAIKADMTAEDEEALLYGDGPADVKRNHPKFKLENVKSEPEGPIFEEPMATYWVFVCRENGLLEIFSLPMFKLVYMIKRFPLGHKTLFDTDPIKLALEADRPSEEYVPIVREILVCGLGANKCRPYLFAIVEQELLVYETFPYYGLDSINQHLHVRFAKIQHNVFLRNQRFFSRGSRQRDIQAMGAELDALYAGNVMFHYFENVGTYSGVFIAGPYPYWLFMTAQGILRTHPMHLDGPVLSFAQFHNVNCFNGFVYINAADRQMRICQLPSTMMYDASIPMNKIGMKWTVHNVVYLLTSKTYALTCSIKKKNTTVVTLLGDEKQFESITKEDPNFIYPEMDQFWVQLYSPDNFEPIPGCRIDLDDFEHVTVMKEIQLKSEGNISGYENYLSFGTIWDYGEDCLIRGRIFICELTEVVPEPGQPLTRHKIKILYNKEQKGPVTSLCSVLGYLLVGMGQKVYIWQFKDCDLIGISFLDMQIYALHMISIKGIVIVGDVFKSISMLRYQEKTKALSLACRDPRNLEVYALEFLVDNKQLGFVVSDALGNIFIYNYHPEAKESAGGTRLLRRGDINIGTRVSSFYRLRCHVTDPIVDHKLTASNRHLVLYGSLDGGLGYLLPLQEKTYRRLFMLQNLLITVIPHYGGLNPKGFRAVKMNEPGLYNPQRNILDGDLIRMYTFLSYTERAEVAKRIGTFREQILDDLLEIQRLVTHY